MECCRWNRLVFIVVVALSCLHHPDCATDPVRPNTHASCATKAAGTYFDATQLSCALCKDLNPRAEPAQESAASGIPCACAAGLVQCLSGHICYGKAANSSAQEVFEATSALECRDCPQDGNSSMAPTQDRSRCLPCGDTTLGYAPEQANCLCPAGHALLERGLNGDYLAAKSCVRCANGFFPGPEDTATAVVGCGACPDPVRMKRNPSTGDCECQGPQMEGGICVDADEFNDVIARFPIASAVRLEFRDVMDKREDLWQYSPFGQSLGIEVNGGSTLDALVLSEAATNAVTVDSSMVKWLYVRCAVGCLRKNATACQCISNLCVLALYDDDATVCRLLTNSLYEGLPAVSSGVSKHVDGMPWVIYEARAPQIFTDPSVTWKFSLGAADSLSPGTTNSINLWMAQYSLEGQWLGWVQLDSQLEMCTKLGGVSSTPRSSTIGWRRFGSSLIIDCKLPFESLLKCGRDPIFYELFIENADASLVAVPVRILNTVRDNARPNLNCARREFSKYCNSDPEAVDNDVLARRFVLCDAVSGKEGEGTYLMSNVAPKVFRWAAHMAMEVKSNPQADGQIYVPVLSIAYASKTASAMQLGELTYVSFAAEYSMSADTYATVVLVLFILMIAFSLSLACWNVFLVDRRFPLQVTETVNTVSIFAHKIVIQFHVFLKTLYSTLFWFQFVMSLYWLFFFKLQDSPHILLPSALFYSGQYIFCDVMLICLVIMGFMVVSLNLYKHMKSFIFLVDWEQARDHDRPRSNLPPMSQALAQGYAPGGHAGGAQTIGSASDGLGSNPNLSLLAGEGSTSADAGVSAWRSIFVCNELNERLTAQRTKPHVTWLLMAFFLNGIGWKNVARWHPAVSGDEGALSAQFNPFLQFAFGASLHLSIVAGQIIVQRIASIKMGHDLKDFVDVCSVANISVFFMDEPFHGYYIHGKAPSSRGDWCHTDLLRVLHQEAKHIGFHRGLVEGAVQTYEFFLPQALDVPMPGGGSLDFMQTLHRYFTAQRDLNLMISGRVPPQPTDMDIAERSRLRCGVQTLIDATVNAVMKSTSEVILERSARDQFLNLPPQGGVTSLHLPVFYEDKEELGWSSCLAYGDGIRPFGLEVPTGFEWHLILFEQLLFSVVWRFSGSVYLSIGVAFLLNRGVLYLYSWLGREMLANKAMIESKFLL